MSVETNFYLAIGYCIFMLLLSWVTKRFPPKKINHFYGYRTARSMKNQDTWETGNVFSSKLMIRYSLYCFFAPPVLYVLMPKYNFVVTVVVHTLTLIFLFRNTENYLKETFDSEGRRIK